MAKPKVTLACPNEPARRKVRYDSEHSPTATADGSCPLCQAEPFVVAGVQKRISADDRAYESNAHCQECGRFVGVLRQETSTLFGLTEDEAMAGLGIRIY